MEPPATTLPPSPWKKPKIVSLSKTKSLKRKSTMFNDSLNNSTNGSFRLDSNSQDVDENSLRDDIDSPKLSKLPKTVLNRFSIMNSNSLSNSFNNSLNESPARNDLYSFFGGNNKEAVLNESSNADEKSSQKVKDKLITTNSSLITNLYSPAGLSLKKTFTETYSDSAKKDSSSKEEEQTSQPNLYEHNTLLPIDWSLKTRLRFLSTLPFSCNNAIKSQQESEAILNFSKFNSFYESLSATTQASFQQSKDLFKTLFGETTNYWTFPYLPWLNLYPRNISVSSFSSEPLSVDIQKNLLKCWNQSFKSLYNSLKSNQCPYFYLLTQSFIVLFRAQNINGMEEMHAILTPSTKGLRETLKDITFTMPLATNSHQNFQASKDQSDSFSNNESVPHDSSSTNLIKDDATTCNTSSDKINSSKDTEKDADDNVEDDEENDDDQEDNEEIDEFLEKIGLNSAVNFKSSNLQRNNKEAQKDSLLYFDSRPRSTLLFSQGGDVQALFNFLLNSKACILSSGPLTGVPPTLLSPLPFVGAALQKIKVEQNVVKSLTKTGEPLTQYALDFIGPIMPFHVHRLCNLFRATQQNEFEMVANTYEQSAALNCVKKATDVIVDKEEMSKYLDMSEKDSLENGYGIFGESASIKAIFIKDDMFCCN